MMKLGSLFDGSGGFPLAGALNGIEPVWASEIEPYPIAVTKSRFPNMKHLGSVTDIHGDEIEPVDIITFGSPCFPASVLVLTAYGYKSISEVRVGDYVLTHLGRWRRVTQTGHKESGTVVLKGNHYGLECTPNHPIYTCGERKNHFNRILLTDERAWCPAEDMFGKLWAVPNTAEALPIPMNTEAPSEKYKPIPELRDDLFYFIGRWLGDGWVRNNQRCDRPKGQTYGQVCICDSLDKEQELCSLVSKLSGGFTVTREKSTVRLSFVNKLLADWLTENFGQYAIGKTLPGWVYGMPDNFRKQMLKGLLDSDGNRVCDGAYRFNTISKKLAESVRLLGEIQGYSTTVFFTEVKPTKRIDGRLVHQHDVYTVALTRGKKRQHFSDGLHGWYRVRKVLPGTDNTTVYNLTVEEDNSYIADGIAVHNCQDLSVAGKRAGLQDGDRSSLFFEAIRIIREMREATNGLYPNLVVWENVPGAFSSNNGADFKAVLDDISALCGAEGDVPQPKKWEHAGYIDCGRGSLAWRLFDSQYWGVAQRRKRIYLIGCLDSKCADKILFESESVRWDPEESRKQRKGIAGCTEEGSAGSDRMPPPLLTGLTEPVITKA